MKILICHNQYQHLGGEDTVVNAEFELLKKKGHEVQLYKVSNDAISGVFKKIQAGLFISHSKTAKQSLAELLEVFRPDIVHFHNTFPLLTASVYDACIELNIPVIQTLHNYRTICPGALLMRKGKVCELCIKGSPFNATLHRCYRNSSVQSLAVSKMVSNHRQANTWNIKVDQFIALTQFAKSKFVEAGFDPTKLSVKPNFIQTPDYLENERKPFALFVGRISEEKGITTLLNAFKELDFPIIVAGSGPLLESLQSGISPNIKILGAQSQQQIYQLMSQAKFLIMPSQWYEGFPMVLVEAFAHSLPVLCSSLGGMKEIVTDGNTGKHFEAGNVTDLKKQAVWMYENSEECTRMGSNALDEYNNKYTADLNYQQLINIYQEALNA
ncbi:MAG: glycosyltransferase [Pseudomonadales bacterium]|nr:glycosyltransferase [Pseudomonadales bacterium]